MPTLAVVGTQWGDEGKGKITDYLAEDADMVVRFQGGTNAGHTIGIGDEVFKLHLLPSGILRKGTVSVIANGVVCDLEELGEEIEQVVSSGRSVEGLRISDRAAVILPYHKILDGAEERYRGKKGVGTTGRGIGPCYADKIARYGIRVGDLLEPDYLSERLDMLHVIKEKLIEILGGEVPDRDEVLKDLQGFGERYEKYITDTSVLVNDFISKGLKVLFEGAQGTMLDIDHGTFPFVTSSSCVSGGICSGAGVPPTAVGEIVGIVKAYTTRVGSGPFPTELHGDLGEHLLRKGGEFGTTTGRARRCGWLDLVIVNHAIRLSGISQMAVTKLDVLNGLDMVKIATAYEIDGEETRYFPASLNRLAKVEPIMTEMNGWEDWEESSVEIARRGIDALPMEMKDYLAFIEKETGVKATILGIGPKREETIDLDRNRWTH
jgi:adenylosuccinate synthase